MPSRTDDGGSGHLALGDVGLYGALDAVAERDLRDQMAIVSLVAARADRPSAAQRRLGLGHLNWCCEYQPIVTEASCIGFEALLRTPDAPDGEIGDYIDGFRRRGQLDDFDELASDVALDGGHRLVAGETLFVNMAEKEPRAAERFARRLVHHAAWSVPQAQVCVEISELQPAGTAADLVPALQASRESGLLLALDDVVPGPRLLEFVEALEPEWLKVDGSLVRALTSPDARRQVTQLIRLADDIGADLVAEQIETAEEFGILKDLGVTMFQGFWIDRFVEPQRNSA